MAKAKALKQAWPQVTRPTRYGRFKPEALDFTPIEMPLGACRPTPLQDLIAQMVRQQVMQSREEEFGSITDEDDFEEDEDYTLDFSKYELSDVEDEDLPTAADFAPPQEPPEVKRTAKDVLDRAYGPGNYPAEWLGETGDAPDPDEPEPS